MSDKFIDPYDSYIHSTEPRHVFLEKPVKAPGRVAAPRQYCPAWKRTIAHLKKYLR